MRWRFLVLVAACCISGLLPPVASAATLSAGRTNKGLYISPLRQYISLSAGESVTRAFTVANFTDETMVVGTHIERFSVLDYSYNYQFGDTNNDWVNIPTSTLTLKPSESRQVTYHITLPKTAAPGGYYYTLFASSTIKSGATKTTLQATTLLYLTVQGTLTRTSVIVGHSLPSLVIDPSVDYSLDVKNTGNVHYFALLSARVDGFLYHNAPSGTSQLLMPGAIRHLAASIVAPVLPGVYKLTYTIKPDDGVGYSESRYFVYAPLWFIILLGFVGTFAASHGYLRLRKRRPSNGE